MYQNNVLRQTTKDITNEAVTEYLNSFYKPLTHDLGALRTELERDAVPVILRETEDFLNTFMEITKPHSVLEIGSACGYSAMFFLQRMRFSSPNAVCKVTTVEKDDHMYLAARHNIVKMGYADGIELLKGDGEEVIRSVISDRSDHEFDLIFIDAAKSHYKRFLDASLGLCSEKGVIICDDTLFQGRPALEGDEPPRKHRTNTKALREFNEYVKNDPGLSACHLSVGNGLTLIKPL